MTIRWLAWGFVATVAIAGCGDDGSGGECDLAEDGDCPTGCPTDPDCDMPVDAGMGDGDTDDGGGDGGSGECADRPAEVAPSRGEVDGVYDADRERVLVFGGNTAKPAMCNPGDPNVVDELWAFRLDCNNWEPVETDGGPSARARFGAVLDTSRDRMVIFGGRERVGGAYSNFAEVWAFDLASDTWSEVETSGGPPPGRNAAAVAYDEARDQLVVFGGNTSTDGATYAAIGDLWILDLETGEWREIDASGGPSARIFPAGAVVGDEFLVFGGTEDFFGPVRNDAWAFDLEGETWREVHDGSGDAPLPRFAARMLADAENGRALMFMGHDNTDLGNSNDVWALDPSGDSWTQVRPGDEPNEPAAGFCDFPADFTIPEEGSPERRHMFAAAQGATQGFVLFGKTDCGNINDAWRFDFTDESWELLGVPTEGEACNRSGETECSSLCF